MPVSKDSVTIIDRKFTAKNAEDVFYQYKAEIIDALRKNLIDHDKDQPGRLIQSIDVNIYERDDKITFELSMEDYWKYVDAGRRPGGKQPPQKAMLDFIKFRGIKGNPKKVTAKNKKVRKALKQISRDKALKQVAFLIGRGIKKKGIKPTHFFTDVINDNLKQRLTADLTAALQKDIEIDFKESIQ